MVKLGVMLAPKQKGLRLFKTTTKEPITTTQEVLLFSFKAESDLSFSIDYDELVIEKRIASGGFGTVFKAQWRGLDVAVKKLHVQSLTPEDKEIFLREIKLMRMLNCQFVVTLMGSTQIPGQPLCLVMEYIHKGALTNLLKGQMTNRLKCKIIYDIARGMNFMHKNHIFHRDLKPDNILVISDVVSDDYAAANIKITDFDTARTLLLDSDDYRQNYQSFLQTQKKTPKEDSRTLSNMGTLIYKAPELMGNNRPDPHLIDKTDVYSYGVLTYQVFTQKEPYSEPPFDKYSSKDIETFVKEEKRLSIPSSVLTSVGELIERCWHAKPRARPSMEQIVSDTQRILTSLDKGRSDSTSSTSNVDVPPLEIHAKIGWVGMMERDAAVHRLEASDKGTFLLRWSARANSYVMSLKGKSAVEHIADIRKNGMGSITVVKQNGDQRTFASLLEYIEAMKKQGVINKPVNITEEHYWRTPDYAKKDEFTGQ